MQACWTDEIVDHTPGPEFDRDADVRHAGLSAADLLKWRWLCATGVYHASGNTLSIEVLHALVRIGSNVESFLCRRSNVWGEHARYFDRCAAGLGIKETESRLAQVQRGDCLPQHTPSGSLAAPAAWEARQLIQFGQTQQLSCDPAKHFVPANDQCPLAFRAHFPCDNNTKDYGFCSGKYGGALVKGPVGPRAIVYERPGEPPANLKFYTLKVVTPLSNVQLALLGGPDAWAFFDDVKKTGLLKYDPQKVHAQRNRTAGASLGRTAGTALSRTAVLRRAAGRRAVDELAAVQGMTGETGLKGAAAVAKAATATEAAAAVEAAEAAEVAAAAVAAAMRLLPVLDNLEVDTHLVIRSLNPLVLDVSGKVTPYHELCISHDVLRETFRCGRSLKQHYHVPSEPSQSRFQHIPSHLISYPTPFIFAPSIPSPFQDVTQRGPPLLEKRKSSMLSISSQGTPSAFGGAAAPVQMGAVSSCDSKAACGAGCNLGVDVRAGIRDQIGQGWV